MGSNLQGLIKLSSCHHPTKIVCRGHVPLTSPPSLESRRLRLSLDRESILD